MKILTAIFSVTLLAATTVWAQGGQHWPFSFDPSLSPDAGAVEAAINAGNATLPLLPLDQLQELDTDQGQVRLWLWPEQVALLQGIGASDAGALMQWPTTPVLCAHHASFSIPPLIPAGMDAGAACVAAAVQIQQDLADLSACILVEQPERYVLAYSPTTVKSDMGSIEDMIGVAGQGFTVAGLPPAGILPDDFVPTLRAVLDKIRNETLASKLQAAGASYTQAASAAQASAACFDPSAVATLLSEISGLQDELAAASSYLTQLQTSGLAAAAQENRCLAAQSRIRNALPYPSLSAPERTFLAHWLGAIYWRMRGGGLIPLGNTTDARYYFVDQAFSRIGEVLAGSDADPVADQFFVDVAYEGWSDWQGMGNGGGDKYLDLVDMSGRGDRLVSQQVPVILNGAFEILSGKGYDAGALVTAGLQMGPGYYYGYYPLFNFRYAAGLTAPYSGYIDWPTAIGEFNLGGALGIGLAKTLLPGKPTNQPPTVDLCQGRSCGDDGCGGSCGSCAAGLTCNSGGQCLAGDAGETADAGALDAGMTGADGGSSRPNDGGAAGLDAGAGPTPAGGGGCGCASTGGLEVAFAAALLLFFLLRRASTGRVSASWQTSH
jgi:hypothetical protein